MPYLRLSITGLELVPCSFLDIMLSSPYMGNYPGVANGFQPSDRASPNKIPESPKLMPCLLVMGIEGTYNVWAY